MRTQLFCVVALGFVLVVCSSIVPAVLAGSAPSAIESVEDLLSRAKTAEKERKYTLAIAAYQRYLTVKPQEDGVRTLLARALSWNGQYAEAETLYEEVLFRHPRDLDVQVALARVKSWQKQYIAAQALYEAVLRENPDYTEAKRGLADTLFWSGEDEAALQLYKEIVAVLPDPTLAQRSKMIEDHLASPEKAETEQLVVSVEDPPASAFSLQRLRVGSGYFSYSNGISDERLFQLEATTRVRGKTIVGRVESIDRFGKRDISLSSEVYSPLWQQSWGYLSAGLSPNADITPRWALGGEVYQDLGAIHAGLSRFELSCGYRHLSFQDDEVDFLFPGVTMSLPYGLQLTEKVYLVPRKGSQSFVSRMSWQVSARWIFSLSASFGESGERLETIQDLVTVKTQSFSSGLEFPLTQRISGEVSYTYEDRANGYTRIGGAFNFIYWW
ncbi:MAG: YaiO family outer membrane beta-barrel protein [Candidatus Binatia bacterium]